LPSERVSILDYGARQSIIIDDHTRAPFHQKEWFLFFSQDSADAAGVGVLDVASHGFSDEVATGFASVPAAVPWYHGVRGVDSTSARGW
jgi:hypothetical protein